MRPTVALDCREAAASPDSSGLGRSLGRPQEEELGTPPPCVLRVADPIYSFENQSSVASCTVQRQNPGVDSEGEFRRRFFAPHPTPPHLTLTPPCAEPVSRRASSVDVIAIYFAPNFLSQNISQNISDRSSDPSDGTYVPIYMYVYIYTRICIVCS